LTSEEYIYIYKGSKDCILPASAASENRHESIYIRQA